MPIDKTSANVGIFRYKKSKFKRRRKDGTQPKAKEPDTDNSESEDLDDVIPVKRGRGRPRKNQGPSPATTELKLKQVEAALNSDTDDDDDEPKDVKPSLKPSSDKDPDDISAYLDPVPCQRSQSEVQRKLSQLKSGFRDVANTFKNCSNIEVLDDDYNDEDDKKVAGASASTNPNSQDKIRLGLQFNGSIKQFRVYTNKLVEDLFKVFADRFANLPMKDLVFTLARTGADAGMGVDTPIRMGLEDGDIFRVERREEVERRTQEMTTSDQAEEAAVDSGDVIRLVVKLSENESKSYKLRKTDPLEKLMRAFAKHKGKEVDSFKFMFDGEVVKPQDTVESLDLEEDDMIEASLRS